MEFSGTASFTIEAWVKPMGSGTRTIIGKYKLLTEGTYVLGIDVNNMLFITRGISPATTTTSATTVPNDVYTHIAVSFNGSVVKLYVNGQLDITAADGSAGTSPTIDVVMGASYHNSGSLINYFSGSIDEVKVWNTVRTQTEIASNINNEIKTSLTGLVAYYKCNDGSGTTLTDSKTGPNGTLVNSPAWVASGANISETRFFGNSLHFDGVNDGVNLGPQTILDFVASSFTIQATVYPTGNGSNFGDGGVIVNNEGRYQIGRDSNGELFINVGSSNPQFPTYIKTFLLLPLNTWTEIALVYDRPQSKIFVYLNGGLQTFSTTISGDITDYLPAWNDVRIGNRQGTSHVFDGRIEELKLWNTARTAAEIKANQNLPIDPATTGLAAYYRFDEGIVYGNNTGVNKLLDLSVNKIYGTLSNFTLSGTTSNWAGSTKFITWLGTNNTNWNTANNWEKDVVPAITENVYIPAGTSFIPVINSTQSVNQLILAPTVDINLTTDFNVAGNLYKYGSFTGTGTLFLNGTTDQRIVGTGSFRNLTVNNPPNNTAFLYDSTNLWGVIIANADATLDTRGYMTMKSDISGSARAGISAGRIIDTIIIERYMPDIGKRAWHLVCISSHCHQQIFNTWQEGGAVTPGRGTLVTSDLYNGTNGFDMASNTASMLIYRQGDANGASWDFSLTNTKQDISKVRDNIQGYMLYIRGDRTYTPGTPGRSATVLRHSGILWQPYRENVPVTVLAIGTGYTLVANPYVSPIDFESIYNTPNLVQNFKIWDPTLGGTYGLGAYRTVERLPNGTYTATPSLGATQDNLLRYINPGMAFLVKATGGNASVSFTQNSKADLNGPVHPIVATPGDQELMIHLKVKLPGNEIPILDGIRIRFNQDFKNSISDDILKMSNFNENLAAFRDGERLTVEKRPMISKKDTIYLQLSKTEKRDYRFSIEAIDFVQKDVIAYLEDTYLNTLTELDLTGSPKEIDFSITSNTASSNPNRFRIVFKMAFPSTVNFVDVNAVKQADDIAVNWKAGNQVNIRQYEIEKATDGINFTKTETKPAVGLNGSNAIYNWIDVHPAAGNNYYRIRSIGNDASETISEMVLVSIGKTGPGIFVYPNPIINHTARLQFSEMEKGVYLLRLINSSGQVLFTKTILHIGTNTIHALTFTKEIAGGRYQLEIYRPDNTKTTIPLFVKD